MFAAIVTLIVFIALSIYLGTVILKDFLIVIVNIPILWAISIRTYYEVRKKGLYTYYAASIGVITVIFLLLRNIIKTNILLWPTQFLLLVFLLSELIQLIHHYIKESKLDKPIDKEVKKFKKWLKN